MANKIVLKKSSVAAKVPLATDLEIGELAVNLEDQKLYSKKADGTVVLVGTGGGGSGDVVGPASATDNAITRYDGTTGKLIQNSTVTLDGNGTLANVNAISLDTTPTTPPTTAGTVYWDAGNGTPSVVLNANTELQLGQENIARVYNGSGATIPNGAVVAVVGAQGQRPSVALADADSESTSSNTLGIATESIADGAEGFICTFGLVRGLDTSAFTAGDAIYLSQTAGQFTQTRPSAPAHTVTLGWVIKANASSGEIFVNISNGWELDELHNVLITSPTGGNLLAYDQTNQYWKNINLTDGTGISVTETTGGAITVTNTAPDQVVSITGAGTSVVTGTYPNFTVTSNDQYNGTVTSVGGTGTVNGITLTGTVTSSGNLTLGGTLSGVDLTTQVTGTLPVSNGGTGATTLTGYVKGTGTSALTASSTIPNTDISGLGTMSTQNSNGVAVTGGTIDGVTIGGSTAAAGTFTSITDSGNLTFTGTGNRIRGDFSNATHTNRVQIQTSTSNGATSVSAIPNGTGITSQFIACSSNDPDNASRAVMNTTSAIMTVAADKTGTGTYLPMAFNTGGSERVRVDTSGNVGVGTSSPYSQLDVYSTIVSPTTGEATGVGSIRITNGASALSSAGGLEFKNAGDSNGFGSKIQALNSGGSQLVFANRFASATWVERMRITNAGDVGIGISSPGARLDIVGATGNVGTIRAAHPGNTSFGVVILAETISGTDDPAIAIRNFNGGSPVSYGLVCKDDGSLAFNSGINPASTFGTERMRLDSSGNLGLGVTPSAWGGAWNAIDQTLVGALAASTSGTGDFGLAYNAYNNNTNWIYKYTGGKAARYKLNEGTHSWFVTGVNGTAGNAISFTQAMTLDASGNLQLQTTTSSTRNITIGTDNASISLAGVNGCIYIGASGTPAGSGGFGVNAGIGRAQANNYHIAGSIAGDFCIAAEGTKALVFGTSGSANSTSERMRITPGGEIYIAGTSTTDQGAYNLQCNGTGVWGAGAYVNGSDARIKEDVAPIRSGLDIVEKLNPVTYRYKEDWSKDQSVQTGFIAQELLTALDGEVYVDGVVQQGGEYMSVAYQNLIPVLTKAIQELKAEFDAYKLSHP